MRKISDFLSKPLISLNNASFEGTIIGFLCGKKLKTIEYLCILIENNTSDEIKYVSIKRIKNANENAVTVLSNLCIKNADDIDIMRFVENPLNSNVYTSDGKLEGRLTDVYFNDTEKTVTEILIDEKPIQINRLASISRDIIILYGEGQPIVRKSAPRKIKKPVADTPVEMLDNLDDTKTVFDEIGFSVDKPTDNTTADYAKQSDTLEITELSLPSALEGAKAEPVVDKMPAKLISDYRFLLGRVVTNNIYNMQKVLIIRANTIVTAEIVEIARKNNKLIELTLSSKS